MKFNVRSNFDSTPPPILIDAGVAVLENEKIERHIMKAVPGGHNLFVQVNNLFVILILAGGSGKLENLRK